MCLPKNVPHLIMRRTLSEAVGNNNEDADNKVLIWLMSLMPLISVAFVELVQCYLQKLSISYTHKYKRPEITNHNCHS